MKKPVFAIVLTFVSFSAFAQSNLSTGTESDGAPKYSISLPVIILPQLAMDSWNDRMHTQHIEFHIKRNLNDKNIIGVKLASWRLFQPMGIVWWDGLLDKLDTQSEFYPGFVRHTGIGMSYQRMVWKGLFTTVEVLPQFKTYLDLDNNKITNGFKLYNSFHLGYHLPIGKQKRFFIEPQVHSQFWVFDTNTPDEFKALDDKWRNYFLFEPNIYVGFNF
jgi:hypothetical protein